MTRGIAGFGGTEVASEAATIDYKQDVVDSEVDFGQTEVADFVGYSVLAAF